MNTNNPTLPEDIEASLEKLNLQDIDALRSLSPEEIIYLFDHCPFLQLVSTGNAAPLDTPTLITAASGWTIHHYGDAMSSSPGSLLFAGGQFRILLDDDDDDGGSGIINPDKGTIVKQTFDTAAEMIALAQQFGWAGVKLIDGHPLMLWAAWMKASDEAYPLEGYEPTKKDRKKRERIKRSDIEDLAQMKIRPGRS